MVGQVVSLVILALCVWGGFQLAKPYSAGETRVVQAVLLGLGILVLTHSGILAVLIPVGLCYLGRRARR